VLSSDGKVAEQGSYKDLSTNPNGAFTKLMEWQMSGGETESTPGDGVSSESRGPPNEAEQVLHGMSEGEEDVEEEGMKVRKGEESKSEVVLEKAGTQAR
jgi:putative ABC transport system ATP-binding protein